MASSYPHSRCVQLTNLHLFHCLATRLVGVYQKSYLVGLCRVVLLMHLTRGSYVTLTTNSTQLQTNRLTLILSCRVCVANDSLSIKGGMEVV